MLFAQQVAKVRGDAFDQISCLTAVTLDGTVLWQQGRPNPKNDLLTNDTPFQIHDLDKTAAPRWCSRVTSSCRCSTGGPAGSAHGVAAADGAGDEGPALRVERRRLAAVRRSRRHRAGQEILLKDRAAASGSSTGS